MQAISRQCTTSNTASILRCARKCLHLRQEQEVIARKHRRPGVKSAPHLIFVSECKQLLHMLNTNQE